MVGAVSWGHEALFCCMMQASGFKFQPSGFRLSGIEFQASGLPLWVGIPPLTYQILSISAKPRKVGLLAYQPVVKSLMAYQPVVKSLMAKKHSQGVLWRSRSRPGHFHPRHNVNRCGMGRVKTPGMDPPCSCTLKYRVTQNSFF